MSNFEQRNSNEKSNGKLSDGNSENEILNQGKILSPKKSLIEKIDELIDMEKSAIEAMKNATEAMAKSTSVMEKSTLAMEKSLKNQEIMVKYIYNAIIKQEEEAKKKKEEV